MEIKIQENQEPDVNNCRLTYEKDEAALIGAVFIRNIQAPNSNVCVYTHKYEFEEGEVWENSYGIIAFVVVFAFFSLSALVSIKL